MWEPQALRYFEGKVSAPGRVVPPHRLARMIVLVHGYNNDRKQARASYNPLLGMLPPEDQDAVWQFYWPGYVERITGAATEAPLSLAPRYDERGTESNMLLSIPSYSAQALKAPTVGSALGAFLEAASPGSLVLVAHSLGCRVALEAVRHLRRPRGARKTVLRGACLMAAAVPTYMVETPQTHWWRKPTGGHLVDAARTIELSFVLHSTRDRVLQVAFPLGQMAAREGVLPEAVGRHGRPDAAWSARGDTGVGHSGYWEHPSTAPATLRAIGRGAVADLLTLQSVQRVTWRLAAKSDLPDRSLAARVWHQVGHRQTLTDV